MSRDAVPARLRLDDPDCFSDDSVDLVAQVSWVGAARSAQPYQLSRGGSY